ncbi:hypothetical protein [Stutzerimonas stutzeri]|uniref:hypothetical protein n=1 Tax=Stutzerimonas stutzeri TaxID=316 RepID=UPI0012D4A107|nr:hypothetical protein [Stutzerimonas stutzeri]
MTTSIKTVEAGQSVKFEKVQTFKIDLNDIEAASTPTTEATWVLSLVNRTNECFEYLQTRNNAGVWGKWAHFTPACRTCNLGSYEACFKAGAYVPILITDCVSPPFAIRIATKPDANGNSHGAEYTGIIPKCQYAGGVIGIE